jgi:hypothetical protein
MPFYYHEFTIAPKDEKASPRFPLDMLRYDRCFFTKEEEANAVQDALMAEYLTGRERGHGIKSITLGKHTSDKNWKPMIRRWERFGWKVMDMKTPERAD